MPSEKRTPPLPDWDTAAEQWRRQAIPDGLVRELRRRTLDGRQARPSPLQRAWLPAVATLALLLVAYALREPEPRVVLRAELHKGQLHLVWFQPIIREMER